MSGTVTDVMVRVSDGIDIAATLYLPAGGAVPCLLEARPYRKDDGTAGADGEYLRLRDEFGYAVCRVDVRGTGSSGGIATDEYPAVELRDLGEVIAWLAAQPWCTGHVGMFGTSYSGFNSLQVALTDPPALRAVCALYATDDRWTDDVHYYGGSLRLLDQLDYSAFMLAFNALPPVPALVPDWREQWRTRLDGTPPWNLGVLRSQRRDPYWRDGSVRPHYERLRTPTMLVGGWADGYRNNSFRTVTALVAQGTPVHLLQGPWAHVAPTGSVPGPRIDHLVEMAAWFDRWLRPGEDVVRTGAAMPAPDGPQMSVFVRRWSPPEPDADTWAGSWRRESVESLAARTTWSRRVLGEGVGLVRHDPDLGLAAWNQCAASLPWGLPTDQRRDDDRALTSDWLVAAETTVIGHPRLRLRLTPSAPVATVAARLCAVAPDGTSVLVSRGLLNLSYRVAITGDAALEPSAVTPGEPIDVVLDLEACAYTWAPGETLRLALAVTEWPSAVAPPSPQHLEVDLAASVLELPEVVGDSPYPPPVFMPPPAPEPWQGTSHVRWWSQDDVLARETSAHIDHGSSFAGRFGSTYTDHYTGSVTIDRRTWEQRASARSAFEVAWPEVRATAVSTTELLVDAEAFDVTLRLVVHADGEPLHERQWHERIPRDLG